MKRKRRILLFALAVVLLGGLGSLVLLPRDRLFHGKPESEWIKGIPYGMSLSDSENQEQIRRWRDFGPEGLRVLERGLNANPGRTYRKTYRRLSPRLPGVLVRLLPAPQMDITQRQRGRLGQVGLNKSRIQIARQMSERSIGLDSFTPPNPH